MKIKRKNNKYCEFCYKNSPRHYLPQVKKNCCWDNPKNCSSRKILVVNFSDEIDRSFMKYPICDYCNKRKALHYFKTNNSWCCSKTIQKCYKRRKGNDYKIIKMLIGHSLFCDYGCGQVAKYIFKHSGFVCCSHAAQMCPTVRKQESETKRKKDPTSSKKKEGILCKCGCGEKVYTGNKFLNKTHLYKYYKETGKGGLYYWKGKKRPGHSKKLRERAHHFRGKKAYDLPFTNRLTIDKIKKRYPIFSIEEEMTYHPKKSGVIQVRCKNHKCKNSKEQNGWFAPTSLQLSCRARTLDRLGVDGNYMYCSDGCKKECILFNVNTATLVKDFLRTSEVHQFQYTQEEYNTWRAEVLKRADYICEFCGKEKATDCHHSKPKKLEPFFSLDPDYGFACCEKCHYKYGHKDECSTGRLASKPC